MQVRTNHAPEPLLFVCMHSIESNASKRIKMHAGSIHLRTADNNSGARSPYAEGGLPGDAQATGNDIVNDSVVAQAPISM